MPQLLRRQQLRLRLLSLLLLLPRSLPQLLRRQQLRLRPQWLCRPGLLLLRLQRLLRQQLLVPQ
jgi:hypothetical protein